MTENTARYQIPTTKYSGGHMAKFVTELDVRLIDDAANLWQIESALVYCSDLFEEPILVEAGFRTDFDSVPRLPLAYWLTGDTGRAAAVVHDYLYRTGCVPRELADAIFFEAMMVSGVPAWRARLKWIGVRAGGWSAWRDWRRTHPS